MYYKYTTFYAKAFTLATIKIGHDLLNIMYNPPPPPFYLKVSRCSAGMSDHQPPFPSITPSFTENWTFVLPYEKIYLKYQICD